VGNPELTSGIGAVLEPDRLDMLDKRLSMLVLAETPFRHATVQGVFDSDTAEQILDWMEKATWYLNRGSFYIYQGLPDLGGRLADTPISWIAGIPLLKLVESHLARIFQRTFSNEKYEVAAHKMVPGHWLGPHNDMPAENKRTHRLVVTLGRDLESSHGGNLVLNDNPDPAGAKAVVPPTNNSAIALEFSNRSYHRVEEIKSGTRYSIVYSFWAKTASASF
jgi:hypothetical protein